MKKEPIIVNVYLWGTCIGKLNWDFEKHCSVFQFTDEYRKQDYDICPSTHPKRTPLFASFYGNKDKLYPKSYLNHRMEWQSKCRTGNLLLALR